MALVPTIVQRERDLIEWRHRLHAHPETAFCERSTSEFIAEKLRSFGIEVVGGLATTGLVGTLRVGTSERCIGLRSEMDALDVCEVEGRPHRSAIAGKMHACGHDGHMAMLLGAARYLAESRDFDGTVRFIFQPAEENRAGGLVMVEQGLFERFPVDAVYAMHNMPGIDTGVLAVRSGPVMASSDYFSIVIRGAGAHGAFPHLGNDPIPIASQIVLALQTIVSRGVDPLAQAVVSITQIHGGDAPNVIADTVELRGTVRAFSQEVQDFVQRRLVSLSEGIAAAHGAHATVTYDRRYAPTVNWPEPSEFAAKVAESVVGNARVERNRPPIMAAEDFGWMLRERPGCLLWIGNGLNSPGLHTTRYDFNDELLPIGASYWARLVERSLARDGAGAP